MCSQYTAGSAVSMRAHATTLVMLLVSRIKVGGYKKDRSEYKIYSHRVKALLSWVFKHKGISRSIYTGDAFNVYRNRRGIRLGAAILL